MKAEGNRTWLWTSDILEKNGALHDHISSIELFSLQIFLASRSVVGPVGMDCLWLDDTSPNWELVPGGTGMGDR